MRCVNCGGYDVVEENDAAWCQDCGDYILCPHCGYFVIITENKLLYCEGCQTYLTKY